MTKRHLIDQRWLVPAFAGGMLLVVLLFASNHEQTETPMPYECTCLEDRKSELCTCVEEVVRAERLQATPAPRPAPPTAPAPRLPRTQQEFNDRSSFANSLQRPDVHVRQAELAGELITLTFRDMPQPKMDWRSWRHDSEWSVLFDAAAEGDDYAAFALWKELQMCEHAPMSAAELQRRQQGQRSNFARSGGADGQNLDHSLAFLEERYERCQGREPWMQAEARQLLGTATQRGDPRASLEYARAIEAENPEEAKTVYEALWRQGHTSGLIGIGNLGSVSHKIAWHTQQIAFDEGFRGDRASIWRDHLAQIRATTSLPELEPAEKEAAELLKNPLCCIR